MVGIKWPAGPRCGAVFVTTSLATPACLPACPGTCGRVLKLERPVEDGHAAAGLAEGKLHGLVVAGAAGQAEGEDGVAGGRVRDLADKRWGGRREGMVKGWGGRGGTQKHIGTALLRRARTTVGDTDRG